MAKANITTKTGTTIVIEGTAEEVAILIDRFNGGVEGAGRIDVPRPATTHKKKSATKARVKDGPKPRIVELIEEGFFKKPKGLGEIKSELEVRAHFYELNALSTPVLRLVKSRELRRIKDNNTWKYVEA